jgi:uncharacterized membrane protein
VRHRTVFGLIILLTAIFSGAHQAQAGLRFCNQGTFKIHTAVGYVDQQKRWLARGWLSIEPGECKDALGFPLENRFYYYYARGRDENAHVEYTGESSFCIETRPFKTYQANYGKSTPDECAKDGLRSKKFKKVDVQGKPEFTVNLGGPDNPPTAGGDPAGEPGQPPTAAVEPRATQQPPAVVRQPPPTAAQQPPPSAAEPPTASADPSMAPPRRRQRYNQEPPPTAVQQPPSAADPSTASADPSMAPPRRRQRYNQEPPPEAMQQPPSAAEPPTASADPSMAPPRRRQRYNQEPPPDPPNAPPAAQGGNGACQRFPNLC